MITDLPQEDLKDLLTIVNSLLDYSGAAIIQNNFIEAFYEYTHNGRLHGIYKEFGTKTFRLTSNSPNMLNSPSTGSVYAKPIKKCFTAEPNHIFYCVDLSALEDRIIANLSRDPNKCSIFTDGIDGHCLNSYYYFTNRVEELLPKMEGESTYDYVKRYKQEIDNGNKDLKAIRQRGKPVTFGLSYGCHPPKVAATIKCPIEQAEEIYNNYHNKLYTKISEMREKVKQLGEKKHQIPLGLGCVINTSDPDKEERTIFNALTK